MHVQILADRESLTSCLTAWQDLAASALEPNPFYEHWLLRPAFDHFSEGKTVIVVAVFDAPGASGRLCGLFPLERIRRYMNLPVTAWSFWKYNHCPLSMPLIRADSAAEVLETFCDWIRSADAGCDVLEFRNVPGEGAFHQRSVDQFHRMGTIPLVWELYTRAVFRPAGSVDQYFSAALSGKHRKALRRRSELLSELGHLEYRILDGEADIQQWIASFLRIESGGWKGRDGSAMACRPANRNFFTQAVSGAFRNNRLLMPVLMLNDKVIAQNCYFFGGQGLFHFKPAFDEDYARFSPGFHMECELIRYLHSVPSVEWLDSCTTSDNEMYNRLFLARKTMQTWIVPVRRGISGHLVSLIPALRSVRRTLHDIVQPGKEAAVKHAEWAH